MRKLLVGCAAMTALLLTAPSAAAAPIIPLDPKTGNIGGRIALAAIPSGTMQLDKRAPCEVHLVPASYDTPEQVFPCNTWFQPPVGRYLFWLEQGAFISYQSVINYGGEEFRRAGMLLSKPLFPAGEVEVQAPPIPPAGTLRLLSLRMARTYRPFDRVIAGNIAARRFRVPAGDVIAGIFDRQGNALALTRPHDVHAGQTKSIALTMPNGREVSVLIVLERFEHPPIPRCDTTLAIDGRRQPPPAVNLQAHDRVVVAWYGRAAGEAQLDVACSSGQTLTRNLHLAAGSVTTVRHYLVKR